MKTIFSQNDKNLPYSPEGDGSVQIIPKSIPKIDTPKMFSVILINDDYTPMDFVVLILKKFFNKTEEESIKIMLDVHQKGAGVAGVFTLEIGEMKVMQTNQFAQMNQYPLKSTLEEVP